MPNDLSFYLLTTDDTVVPSVQFLDASLFMHRSKIAYQVVEAHMAALQKGIAKYPISRAHVKAFNINSGTTNSTIDNAIYGVYLVEYF